MLAAPPSPYAFEVVVRGEGGGEDDSLCLCAESRADRHAWISHIKSRLSSLTDADRLAKMYVRHAPYCAFLRIASFLCFDPDVFAARMRIRPETDLLFFGTCAGTCQAWCSIAMA